MWSHLTNLAGHKDPDKIIRWELERAMIEAVSCPSSTGEVKYSVMGKMSGGFEFTRAWTYWVVDGLVPIEIAVKLYADPVGREDIRVAGHCGCPPPAEPWVTWLDDDGKKVIPAEEKANFEAMRLEVPSYIRFDAEPRLFKPYVTSYHIDSEVGLRIFADTLRGLSFHQMVTLDKLAKVAIFPDDKYAQKA